MLGRFSLNLRLDNILTTTLKIREENQELIREKLAIYKRLVRQSNRELIDDTIGIINKQHEILKAIRDRIISCHLSDFSWKSADHQEKELMMEGKYLINGLLSAFEQQKNALNQGSLRDYRVHFKEELAAYKEYEQIAKRIPPQIIKKAKKSIEHFHPYDPLGHMKFLVFLLVVYALLGLGDPAFVERNFKDLKTSLITLGIGVGISFFLSLFGRILARTLRRIRKIRKRKYR
jgi:hypothetical protein